MITLNDSRIVTQPAAVTETDIIEKDLSDVWMNTEKTAKGK